MVACREVGRTHPLPEVAPSDRETKRDLRLDARATTKGMRQEGMTTGNLGH